MRSDDGRVVSNFIVQALNGQNLSIYGDGSQTRSFCYATDLINGIVRLLEKESAGTILDSGAAGRIADSGNIHYPVNIGNPGEFTVLQLAKKVISMTSSASKIDYQPLPVDDPKVRRPVITRARNLLGWEPTVDLDNGLSKTIEYFRAVTTGARSGS